MRFGIIDYLLRVKEDACFYLAQELGFDCLELSVDHIGDPSRLLFAPDGIDDLKALGAATGVRVESVYATHFLRENLVDANEDARQPALLALRALTERVAEHGIDTIVVPLFGASEVRGDAEAIALQSVLDNAGQWGALHGVRFALHTTMPAEQLAAFVTRWDDERLGICFDPGFGASLDRAVGEDVRRLGDRIIHVHLKDRVGNGDPTTLGQGDCDLAGFTEAISAIGYAGPIVLETPSGRSAIDAAKSNLDFCRRSWAA